MGLTHNPVDCPVGDPDAPVCATPAHQHPATCPDCRVGQPWTLNDSRQDDEPEHVCGPWPYLFEGECPGCQWREDRA